MLVVDASVLAPALLDAGAGGQRIRDRLRGEVIVAPDLLLIEVVSVIRRHVLADRIARPQAAAAVDDLRAFPIRMFPAAPLIERVWGLRDNLSPYDACYVALAEALDVPLLTADQRMAAAPGVLCRIEVI